MPTPLQPAAPPLPRANILSYVAKATTPTRVRHVAARSLQILGGTSAVLALACLVKIVDDAWRIFSLMRPAPLSFLITNAFFSNLGSLILLLLFATAAADFFACATPVRRGSSVACTLSIIAIVPLMLVVGFIGAAFGIVAFLYAFPHKYRDEPLYLLFLLVTAACVLGFLILYDVARYLQWISKNPAVEIPPVQFLDVR